MYQSIGCINYGFFSLNTYFRIWNRKVGIRCKGHTICDLRVIHLVRYIVNVCESVNGCVVKVMNKFKCMLTVYLTGICVYYDNNKNAIRNESISMPNTLFENQNSVFFSSNRYRQFTYKFVIFFLLFFLLQRQIEAIRWNVIEFLSIIVYDIFFFVLVLVGNDWKRDGQTENERYHIVHQFGCKQRR